MKLTNQNNIPSFVEEQVFKEQEQNQIQEILNRFKQPILSNFLKLEVVKKNNWGSTEGLDKIACERYLFKQGDKQIWLDIPHPILDKLELLQGESCPWPFYLAHQVLERESTEGAITIENESEIFLDKPVSEKNVEKELEKRLEELDSLRRRTEESEAKLQKQDEEKEALEEKNEDFEREINILEKKLSESEKKNTQIIKLEEELENEKKKKKELLEEKNNLQSELNKEKGWWDKWEKDGSDVILQRWLSNEQLKSKHLFDDIFQNFLLVDKNGNGICVPFLQAADLKFAKSKVGFYTDEAFLNKANAKGLREGVKKICEYYKNK